jgi:hypothetical protein
VRGQLARAHVAHVQQPHLLGERNMSNESSNNGIRWEMEEVSRRRGANDSDKSVIGKAPIAIVDDVDKFRASFGDEAILGIFNGTSIRVMCQDVGRRGLERGSSVDVMKTAILNRLKGVRNASGGVRTVTVEKKIYNLPDGTKYTGTDLTELRAAYMAAMVDAGVDTNVARMIAEQQEL